MSERNDGPAAANFDRIRLRYCGGLPPAHLVASDIDALLSVAEAAKRALEDSGDPAAKSRSAQQLYDAVVAALKAS